MKILKKNQISIISANQKKDQIDEGLKIAARVDALRETLSQVQKQHRDYIEGMKAELDGEISPLVIRRDELREDISIGVKKLSGLQTLLDDEWKKVNKKESELLSLEKSLKSKELELSEECYRVELQNKEARTLLAEGTEISEKASEEFELGNLFRKERERLLENAKAAISDRFSEIERKEAISKTFEKSVSLREIDLDNREENLDKKESELDVRERFINDKYQTLLITEEHVRRSKQGSK